MRTTSKLLVALTILCAPIACTTPASETAESSDAELSMPQGIELEEYLAKTFASGSVDVAPDAAKRAALTELDADVSQQTLDSMNGAGLTNDGADVLRVSRPDGSRVDLAFRNFASEDRRMTAAVVRVADSKGSVRIFAERDVVRGDLAQPNEIVSTLYTVDSDGALVKVKSETSRPSDVTAGATELGTSALHTLGGSFGSPKLCTACKSIIRTIKLAQPALTFLLSHHFFTAACVGVGAAAGAAAVETGPGAAAAAAGGYRGCRIVMAGAAALVVLGIALPSEEAGRITTCNHIAELLPGGSPWCVESGPPTCGLSIIHSAHDPLAQCRAVGLCARDSHCPDPTHFCDGLLLAQNVDPGAAAHCQGISALACSPTIQSDADLTTACRTVVAH
jgi:hypothetical protein